MEKDGKEKREGLKGIVVRTAAITLAAFAAVFFLTFFLIYVISPKSMGGIFEYLGNERAALDCYIKEDYPEDDLNAYAKMAEMSGRQMEKHEKYAGYTADYIDILRKAGDFDDFSDWKNETAIESAEAGLHPFVCNYKNHLSTLFVRAQLLKGGTEEAFKEAEDSFAAFFREVDLMQDGGDIGALPYRSFSVVTERIFADIGLSEKEGLHAEAASFSFGKTAFFFSEQGETAISENIRTAAIKMCAMIKLNTESQNVGLVLSSAVYALWLRSTAGEMCLLYDVWADNGGGAEVRQAYDSYKSIYDDCAGADGLFGNFMKKYESMVA